MNAEDDSALLCRPAIAQSRVRPTTRLLSVPHCGHTAEPGMQLRLCQAPVGMIDAFAGSMRSVAIASPGARIGTSFDFRVPTRCQFHELPPAASITAMIRVLRFVGHFDQTMFLRPDAHAQHIAVHTPRLRLAFWCC